MGLVEEEKIIDIDLSATRRKKFRINGDNNRMLELNVADLNIVTRLNEVYPKLEELSRKAATELGEIETTEDGELTRNGLAAASDTLQDIDKGMRELMDYLFDSNVSEICAPDGSMYDLFNGEYRFEHIINVLSGLYETNMQEEHKKLSKRMQLHTSKYTAGKRTKK